MSEKSTNSTSFTSGRPDRIKAALQPKDGLHNGGSVKQRERAPKPSKDANAYMDSRGILAASETTEQAKASQRALLGQGPKRKASDNLSEILKRQRAENSSESQNSKRFNTLSGSANDDIAQAAELLEDIKSDSNRKPIFAAIGFTVMWMLLCAAVGLAMFNSGLVDLSAISVTSLPVLVAIAAVLFIPCILSWGVAVFLYRARELHQISLSLAYTALHLTQPEDMASESVATIGQAVRREIAAMGDGIDRAITRATTLENKFRNEVGNIQGFYKNNENIFNKIIRDLEKERDLMSATGDNLEARLPKILDGLKESSFDFSKIVQSADERFTALASTADTRLANLSDSIAEKNKTLQSGLDDTIKNVSEMTGLLDDRTRSLDHVTEKLATVGNVTSNKLEKISGNFKRQTTDLGFATTAILKANEEISLALQARHEGLSSSAEHLLENAEQINGLLSSFANVIDKSLLNAEDRSQTMQSMLRGAAEESAKILHSEMGNIRKTTSVETQKLIELLKQSSYMATTSLRDEIQTVIGGSQGEVQAALTMLLKESQIMGDNLRNEANSITDMMQREMQIIKDSAVGNTEQSLVAIRQSHELAIADIIGRIEQAGEKLTGTTESLTFVTSRMDEEMESTRASLADVVNNIPLEAKQALVDMQSFVDDQVSALSELAKIVGGLGSVVSVPDAKMANRPASTQRPARTKSAAPKPQTKREARPTSRLSSGPTSPASQKPSNNRAQQKPTQARPTDRTQQRPVERAQQSPVQRPISRQPATAQPQPRAAQARAPQTAATRGQTPDANKWEMPDLLSRASSSQPLPDHLQPRQNAAPQGQRPQNIQDSRRAPQNELHSVESLNALSLDLAKALDHEAPDQLWTRYRNGERNVFTRRLYTLRGQKLFDEVSHKYQNEPNFRRDVDRYIGDFEELLTKIYEQDRDSMLIDTYLSSETGKVYLMLAHASGRLDQ